MPPPMAAACRHMMKLVQLVEEALYNKIPTVMEDLEIEENFKIEISRSCLQQINLRFIEPNLQ